jgi:hypothetical protein
VPIEQVEVVDHTKINGRRVRLADLLDAGLLQSGDSLFWNRPQLGKRFEGTVTENGAIVLTDGRSFSSPSRAAVVAADIPAADGWLTWRVDRLDGKSLERPSQGTRGAPSRGLDLTRQGVPVRPQASSAAIGSPNVSEDPGQELLKAAAEGGVEGFLRTIAPFVVEGGAWGADVIRWLRFKTEVKILRRAKALCEEAGISPRAIPLKKFVPLLEYASLEDDPEEAEDRDAAEAMHERWAALLANAAIGEAGSEVSPSFPRIMSELTAPEAAMLEWLATQGGPVDRERLLKSEVVPDTPDAAQEERERALMCIENLQRLALCEVEPPGGGEPAPFGTFYKVGERYWTNVTLTRFGRAFVAACTPPTPPGEAQP